MDIDTISIIVLNASKAADKGLMIEGRRCEAVEAVKVGSLIDLAQVLHPHINQV